MVHYFPSLEGMGQILHGSATTTGDLGGRERTSADIEADIASEVRNFAKPKNLCYKWTYEPE